MSFPSAQSLAPVVVAVTDPLTHPEALHIAAATSRPVVEVSTEAELMRHYGSAFAILIDDQLAEHLAQQNQPRREKLFFVAADQNPMNFELAMAIHAEEAYAIPAEAQKLLADMGRRAKNAQGLVVGVSGVVGGSGVSTCTAALALEWSAHAPTTVVDPHVWEGGIDLTLGIEDEPGPRWEDLSFDHGEMDAADLRRVLPSTATGLSCITSTRGSLERCTLSAEYVSTALTTLREDGYTVVDLGAVHRADSVVCAALDHLVVLVPLEVRATSALALQMDKLRALHIPLTFVAVARGWEALSEAELERILPISVGARMNFSQSVAKTIEHEGLAQGVPRALRRPMGELMAAIDNSAIAAPRIRTGVREQ